MWIGRRRRTASVGGAAAATLKPVAGRTFLPAEAPANTNVWLLAETRHILMDAVTSIEVWWPNWRCNDPDIGEVLPGAAATATAQITYNDATSGTLTTVNMTDKTGGTTAMSTIDGGNLKAVATINAARGSIIKLRIRANMPSGIVYTGYKADIPNGDLLQYGATVPSLTTTPTNTNAGILAWYGPCAILGATSRPTFGIAGDSRDGGYQDNPNDIYGFTGEWGRLLGRYGGHINVSVPGQRADYFADPTKSVRRRELLRLSDYLCIGLGVNDSINGRTAAQIQTDLQTIRAAIGKTTVIKTIDPCTTSNADNTPRANNSIVQTLNAAIRGGLAGFAGVFDQAAQLESGTTGSWASLTYTTDGIHIQNWAAQMAASTSGFNFALVGSPTILSLTPSQVLGSLLDGWLDASDASTITVATGVSQWADKSGTGNHATQATGAAQPSRVTNGVSIAGSTGLAWSVSASNDDEAVFAVVTPTTLTSNRTLLGPSVVGARQLRLGAFSADGSLFVLKAGVGGFVASAQAATASVMQILGWMGSKNGNNTFDKNGTTDTAAGSTTSFAAGSTTTLGYNQNLGQEPFAGVFNEIFHLSANPSATQRQYIEGYAAAKWDALTSSTALRTALSTTHPYKYQAA